MLDDCVQRCVREQEPGKVISSTRLTSLRPPWFDDGDRHFQRYCNAQATDESSRTQSVETLEQLFTTALAADRSV
jgi:hypothetical protein